MLSDHYFGDVEAIDEGRNHSSYFHKTFVLPNSFSISSLNNNRKFIVVGRKGAGKTAIQFHLASQLESSGYLTHFFSFYNDLKPTDYNQAAAGQKIDLLGFGNSSNIFLNYDFRDLWQRTFFIKMAETLRANDFESKFVRFALGDRSRLSSIFEGILRSATVKVTAEMKMISAEFDFDLSAFTNDGIPLSTFVHVCRELFLREHQDHRLYLFVDELVFSKLDAKDDEVRVRAAMVRDVFRTARDLNNFFVQNDLDVHVICSVRPEIRDLINDLDSEIGKIFDGKTVELSWDMREGDDSLLFLLLKQKVIHSKLGEVIDFSPFTDEVLNFGSNSVSLEDFIRTNTWSRPRDIVQLLNSIADKNQNSDRIGIEEIKSALNEYGRRSFVEIVEEISVRHGGMIALNLRKSVNQSHYREFSEFERKVLNVFSGIDRASLVEDLFQYGVIGNYDDRFSRRRYYWAHRGEEFFKKSLGVSIHKGLWNYFNIR
ncbi:P-loop ATPase, Sll1717 family [Phaeobacter italicus]|uniref:P-loop ATPase, Sll1717 family n=1 Tax=Phaeobacter italicus TaxID=481446 RepID=UPI0024312ADB|nr:hypothetical protein [Phaeobacter italicus]MCI5099796.1 hypothetical protein [Phaeobacter italicus]